MEIFDKYSLEKTCRTCLKNEDVNKLISIFKSTEQQVIEMIFGFSFMGLQVIFYFLLKF